MISAATTAIEARSRSGHKRARHTPNGLRDDSYSDEFKAVQHVRFQVVR